VWFPDHGGILNEKAAVPPLPLLGFAGLWRCSPMIAGAGYVSIWEFGLPQGCEIIKRGAESPIECAKI
jgi:hypothetical protein